MMPQQPVAAVQMIMVPAAKMDDSAAAAARRRNWQPPLGCCQCCALSQCWFWSLWWVFLFGIVASGLFVFSLFRWNDCDRFYGSRYTGTGSYYYSYSKSYEVTCYDSTNFAFFGSMGLYGLGGIFFLILPFACCCNCLKAKPIPRDERRDERCCAPCKRTVSPAFWTTLGWAFWLIMSGGTMEAMGLFGWNFEGYVSQDSPFQFSHAQVDTNDYTSGAWYALMWRIGGCMVTLGVLLLLGSLSACCKCCTSCRMQPHELEAWFDEDEQPTALYPPAGYGIALTPYQPVLNNAYVGGGMSARVAPAPIPAPVPIPATAAASTANSYDAYGASTVGGVDYSNYNYTKKPAEFVTPEQAINNGKNAPISQPTVIVKPVSAPIVKPSPIQPIVQPQPTPQSAAKPIVRPTPVQPQQAAEAVTVTPVAAPIVAPNPIQPEQAAQPQQQPPTYSTISLSSPSHSSPSVGNDINLSPSLVPHAAQTIFDRLQSLMDRLVIAGYADKLGQEQSLEADECRLAIITAVQTLQSLLRNHRLELQSDLRAAKKMKLKTGVEVVRLSGVKHQTNEAAGTAPMGSVSTAFASAPELRDSRVCYIQGVPVRSRLAALALLQGPLCLPGQEVVVEVEPIDQPTSRQLLKFVMEPVFPSTTENGVVNNMDMESARQCYNQLRSRLEQLEQLAQEAERMQTPPQKLPMGLSNKVQRGGEEEEDERTEYEAATPMNGSDNESSYAI